MARSIKRRILTNHVYKQLNDPELFDLFNKKPQSKSAFYTRLRRDLKEVFKELSEIAETRGFIENVENDIFTSETLRPFFSVVFRTKENMSKKERDRLVWLSRDVIDMLGHDFAYHLNPELYLLLREMTHDEEPVLSIRALYLTRDWRVVHETEGHRRSRGEKLEG